MMIIRRNYFVYDSDTNLDGTLKEF